MKKPFKKIFLVWNKGHGYFEDDIFTSKKELARWMKIYNPEKSKNYEVVEYEIINRA